MVAGGGDVMLNSEKAQAIIEKQKPMNKSVVNRVKEAFAKKGVIVDQSEELDKYLISQGKEAITFSNETIIMHTKVSASGFYEELIHYGQIKSGQTVEGDKENQLIMEIEAQKRLIKYQKSYKITDYEVEILQNNLNDYNKKLKNLKKGGN